MSGALSATVQAVSHLNGEMKTLESVLQLNTSHLAAQILRPIDFPVHRVHGLGAPFEYCGFDPLNDEQGLIMRHICDRWSNANGALTLIDGPPGTGKTHLIANLIMQLMYGPYVAQRPRKFLVCAVNNSAVDAICRRLLNFQRKLSLTDGQTFSLMRFGTLERMHPEVQPVSLRMQQRNGRSMVQLIEEVYWMSGICVVCFSRNSPMCNFVCSLKT